MGNKKINTDTCIQCSKCVNICPYGAIVINGYPEFDESKCHGCFACYNHCPKKAVFTNRFKEYGVYSELNNEMKDKLREE